MITALWLLGRRDEAAAARRHKEATPEAYHVFADCNAGLFPNGSFAETMTRALRESGLPE